MKKQIVNIAPLQAAKVLAALYFVISLPIIVIMIIPTLMSGAGFSVLFLIGAPFMYAIFGFIFTAIGAWVYNMVAAKIGGVEYTTSEADAA